MIYPLSEGSTPPRPSHTPSSGMMLTDLNAPHQPGYAQNPTAGHLLDKTDHPGLRGNPLAMMALQCNKLSSMSPPPLADAAVGKGFHPWKKSGGSGSPETVVTQARSTSQQLPVTTSHSPSNATSPYPGQPTTPSPNYGSDQSEAETSQQSSVSRMDPTSIATSVAHLQNMQSMYSAGVNPYAAWQAGASHIKSETNPGLWWDMHNTAAATMHAAQMANYADYSAASALSLASNQAAQLFSAQTQAASQAFGLSQVTGAAPNALLTRNQRRYTGKSVCDCPNCGEAERLGPAGAHLFKKNVHNCHVPGCDKVYSKTSHLKAHLRWHNRERPFVCTWLMCNKQFTRSDDLQRHLQSHTGEKRFACTTCNKKFEKANLLQEHKTTCQEGKSEPYENKHYSPAGSVNNPQSPHSNISSPGPT